MGTGRRVCVAVVLTYSLCITEPRGLLCCSDISKLCDGIGDKIPLMFQNISGFSIGLVISLIKSWKLSLAILSTSPLIMAASALCSRVSKLILVLAAEEEAQCLPNLQKREVFILPVYSAQSVRVFIDL